MAETSLSLTPVASGGMLATLKPPQTVDNAIPVGKGAYCFVIDVSGSMNAAAQITTDDGDKVNHGWSQLDIAKHSTNTFVSSLEDGDYFSVVTYSDGANVLVDWTKCDEAGRERCIKAIHSMKVERSTNLMAGITTGFGQFEKFLGLAGSDGLDQYALNLVITTDGMPSAQWHPARGRDGYAPLVKTLRKQLASKHPAAPPTITTIGIGFQLDSELLLNMSEFFLHMPDPGQIGPFIVNLLACVRCTARLPTKDGSAANACSLLITPASALEVPASPAPGYKSEPGPGGVRVLLGSVLYDQARHVLLKTKPDAAFEVVLEVGGAKTAVMAVSTEAPPATPESETEAGVQGLRVAAIEALKEALELGTKNEPTQMVSAPLLEFIAAARASAVAGEPAVIALANTIEKECVLGCDQATNFKRWGNHYFRTLPCMLAAERRSNFRDEALQHFGKDVDGREALFEDQSNGAEMKFATLKPPEPSLLNPQPAMMAPPPPGGMAGPATAAAPPPRPMALPDEFMRGGGCFGPTSTVQLALADGASRTVRVAEVRAGDRLVGEGGRASRVVCVVLTPCAGGRAMLTRLPDGTELTEWHPIRDGRGCWRFPHMLGQRVVVRATHVYNFVLEPGHPTVLVGGVPCAALGHGLDAPTVAHPYWGTRAVIDDLRGREGWAEGRVVLEPTAQAA